ncbi:VWA domain-containing protein [Eudoraea chungangensis]|uniref:VWA domain-containing protein n=1 Tax=Eudoraea chungangensis TaxID=1481905 RepID=UPI0023EBC85B|nr:VWA domain-containing protein [Eudoraea chungangensis]
MDDLSLNEYIKLAWENLFFLRPDWLYAFFPILLLIILFVLNHKRRENWKRNYAAHLLPYLTIPGTSRQFIIPKALLVLLLSLMTLALAGPTWERIEKPGQRTEAVMIVLLDLSRSMLAEDIQPNRLERAKLKLKDFFKANPNSKTSLVAYAGSAHSVVPFSKDYKTINKQMEALRPDIMPVMGTNLDDALNLADSLLALVQAPSTILIVSDNFTTDNIQRIAQTASHTHMELMAISTPNGATIPRGKGVQKDASGNTVISRLDISTLDQLGTLENVNVVTVTLDDTDVSILAARVRQNLEFIIDLDNAEEDWQDQGIWLVFPLLFISLFWFRRGWKVHWIWLLLFSFNSCNRIEDFSLKNLFYSADQRAQRLLEKGEKVEAAETFTSDIHKGYVYYQMGELDKAAEAYSRDVSPEGFYNLGVVYSDMGDLKAAQQAFDAALQLDPEMAKASINLEKLAQVNDSITEANSLAEDNLTDPDGKPKEFQEYTEVPDEKDVAQKSDETYKGKGDVQEMVTKEVDENTIDIFELDESIVLDKDAAKQTLLRQVTEDPSVFLRRKFAYQIKNRTIKPEKQLEDW